MDIDKVRHCPICNSKSATKASPYITQFSNHKFKYLKCCSCSTVFVDPIPDRHTFVQMYAKSTYHDCGYEGEIGRTYQESVQLLQSYANTGATVLDYGCGLGTFLKELDSNGFIPFGVEFDVAAANFASKNASCDVWTINHFLEFLPKKSFDVIHLGDVLEHLPEPADIMDEILTNLKNHGILFVEGPLEINPSPVYWSTQAFGWIKHIIRPNFIANDPPHHLFRTGAEQQLKFFLSQINTPLHLKYWRVYETGWPYIEGSLIKRVIAKSALFLGGKRFFSIIFGNRFQAIFIKK
jgi:2-polyprenyl-3-methyl-5-hydroxy-6-metoxy-1,4-benzoquinol methylase